jgi:hypothetical protein
VLDYHIAQQKVYFGLSSTWTEAQLLQFSITIPSPFKFRMSESRKRKKREAARASSSDNPASDDAHIQWEDVKKARNRINSQRTREREKFQLDSLEAEKTRLTLSNDALIFQNNHFRESIRQITEVQKRRRARDDRSGNEAKSPQNSLSSRPTIPVDLDLGAVRGRGGLSAPATDHEAYRGRVTDPLRYSGLERRFNRFPSSMQIPGTSSLDELRVRHQAVLEAEAALLHRQRVAEIGSLRSTVPSLTRAPPLMVNLPAGMLPPLDIMEIRARQLRMQELEYAAGRADLMGRYPQGIPAPATSISNFDSLRDIREDSKQNSRHVEDRNAKSRK